MALFSKKEQDELEQKLLAKEAELAEKSARLEAAETEKQVLVVQGNGRRYFLKCEFSTHLCSVLCVPSLAAALNWRVRTLSSASDWPILRTCCRK